MNRFWSIFTISLLAVLLVASAANVALAEGQQGQGCNEIIVGQISAVLEEDNAIVIGDDIVYGIPLDYLENWEGIVLKVDDSVVINAHQCPTAGKLMACDLTIGDDYFDFRPRKHQPR